MERLSDEQDQVLTHERLVAHVAQGQRQQEATSRPRSRRSAPMGAGGLTALAPPFYAWNAEGPQEETIGQRCTMTAIDNFRISSTRVAWPI